MPSCGKIVKGVNMSRKASEEKSSVQITITLPKELFEKVVYYAEEVEFIPRSAFIARILRKYFEQKK